MPDDSAEITFKSTADAPATGGDGEDAEESKSAVNYYLELRSDKMNTGIEKQFPATFQEKTKMKGEYSANLKKEVFSRFFQVLKMPGQAKISINDKETIDMEYVVDKCPHIMMFFETASRVI